ncbi:ATP phosphoribosyltransferase regulatory subunit [Oceanibium sediminis]|uniref:ATP phosphoribosyltransferase regulatory subunit n=1 Tax=Oceanibium sediminis TaxID=2026339 RepID=UPI000DD39E05|nr:ATP phosphoribosyltransferase regulatory subunit [Oceanibium sediminis]
MERAIEAEVARLLDIFREAGAERFDPPVLQPADVLLDLYGEDIRARAFVTHDDTDELMLRPDFTVPLVQAHMARARNPARYAYAGPVWRRQPPGSMRAREYLQAGFEVFDATDPAAADAEVFALIADSVAGARLHPTTGDIGLLIAAIDGIDTTAPRRAALRRHLWRPERFERLLRLYSSGETRKPELVSLNAEQIAGQIVAAGPALGLRTPEDVASRIERLAEDARTPPIARADVDLIEALLAIRAPCEAALRQLRDLACAGTPLADAVDRFAARLDALAARGIDIATLPFQGAFGRTTLEYYDGFVFGFLSEGRDLPMVASGGRYDALTRALGGGAGVPAVGGIIRPEMLVTLRGAAGC